MKKLFSILLIIQCFLEVRSQTGLAEKPPLGWNSFDSYGVYLYEKAAYENLEAFID